MVPGHGAQVHVLGLTRRSLDFARTLGVHGAWTAADIPRMLAGWRPAGASPGPKIHVDPRS
jgi:hypothetical protein